MKIGFIGVGKMATSIITGLSTTRHQIIISGSSPTRSQEIAERLQVDYAPSHEELIAKSDLIILGIKPQLFEEVLADLVFHQPIISMAAGITLNRLGELTNPQLPLVRIMPNINAQILRSTTAICTNQHVNHELEIQIKSICDSFGSTYDIAEKDFDSFTALAGSSPAYIYLFIEALAKAGVKNGFPKTLALDIVTQTVMASAQHLLEANDSPHNLIDKICSPGGTTIAGILELERLGLTHTVCAAIDQTIEKAKSL